MVCPHCKGKGESHGIMCGPSGCRTGYLKCSTCDGTGEITLEHAERVKAGRVMREDRIERMTTMREEAKRLGCGFAEWSRIEQGEEPETDAGKYALTLRLEEIAALPPKDTTEVRCPVCNYRRHGSEATQLLTLPIAACKGCGRSVAFERVESSAA